MTKNSFTIPFRLPGYNEQTNEDRRNRHAGAQMRKGTEDAIILAIRVAVGRKECRKIAGPCTIRFTWRERNRNRDLDNIFFAKKYILDAMQTAGILENDSQKWVRGLEDHLEIVGSVEEDGVLVEIEELEK